MFTEIVNSVLEHLGYRIHRVPSRAFCRRTATDGEYPPLDVVWPLPRVNNELSDESIRQEFAKYDFWHYPYDFGEDLSFPIRHSMPSKADDPERHFQRFRHFMPYLVGVCGGSLDGKTVLDVACNSGFWSIQCALLGAQVVGFDARPELIDQANLVKSIVGLDNVAFRTLDFWDMNPEAFGRTFDIVLNLGVLFHLPDPLEVLRRTARMAREYVLLDTTLHPMADPVISLGWEEVVDIRSAARAGIVAHPSKSAIELMFRHLGVADFVEIPVRTTDLPRDYLVARRASWLIEV